MPNQKFKALVIGSLTLLLASGLAAADSVVSSQVCSNPPPTTITSPADQSTTSDDPVIVQGQAEAGAVVNIRDNDSPAGSASVPANGVYSVPIHLTLGSHQLQADMTDGCGASVNSAVITVTKINPPAAPNYGTTLGASTSSTGRSSSLQTSASTGNPNASPEQATNPGGHESRSLPGSAKPKNGLSNNQRAFLFALLLAIIGACLMYLLLAGRLKRRNAL